MGAARESSGVEYGRQGLPVRYRMLWAGGSGWVTGIGLSRLGVGAWSQLQPCSLLFFWPNMPPIFVFIAWSLRRNLLPTWRIDEWSWAPQYAQRLATRTPTPKRIDFSLCPMPMLATFSVTY